MIYSWRKINFTQSIAYRPMLFFRTTSTVRSFVLISTNQPKLCAISRLYRTTVNLRFIHIGSGAVRRRATQRIRQRIRCECVDVRHRTAPHGTATQRTASGANEPSEPDHFRVSYQHAVARRPASLLDFYRVCYRQDFDGFATTGRRRVEDKKVGSRRE